MINDDITHEVSKLEDERPELRNYRTVIVWGVQGRRVAQVGWLAKNENIIMVQFSLDFTKLRVIRFRRDKEKGETSLWSEWFERWATLEEVQDEITNRKLFHERRRARQAAGRENKELVLMKSTLSRAGAKYERGIGEYWLCSFKIDGGEYRCYLKFAIGLYMYRRKWKRLDALFASGLYAWVVRFHETDWSKCRLEYAGIGKTRTYVTDWFYVLELCEKIVEATRHADQYGWRQLEIAEHVATEEGNE
jgi:hypothetical protein